MLNHLSQPVAFAMAPLVPPETNGHPSNDTDVDDPFSKTLSRGLGFVKAAKSRMLTRHDSSLNMLPESDGGRAGISTFPPKPPQLDDWDDELGEGELHMGLSSQSSHQADGSDDDMVDSFFMIPSKSDPPISALKQENAQLKSQLEEERKRLAMAERMLKQRQEQDHHLRESIILARKEVSSISQATLQPARRIDVLMY